jgi:ankyrin repeat protein
MMNNPLIVIIFSQDYYKFRETVNFLNANYSQPLAFAINKSDTKNGEKIALLLLDYVENLYEKFMENLSGFMYINLYPNELNMVVSTTYLHLATIVNNKNIINTLLKMHENNVSKNRSTFSKNWLYPFVVNYYNIINEQDDNGNTPLHIASYNSNYYQIELFIKNEGDPRILNNRGESIFDIAGRGSGVVDIKLIKFIEECYNSVNRKKLLILCGDIIEDIVGEIISYL